MQIPNLLFTPSAVISNQAQSVGGNNYTYEWNRKTGTKMWHSKCIVVKCFGTRLILLPANA